jgi:hypothetical protein
VSNCGRDRSRGRRSCWWMGADIGAAGVLIAYTSGWTGGLEIYRRYIPAEAVLPEVDQVKR